MLKATREVCDTGSTKSHTQTTGPSLKSHSDFALWSENDINSSFYSWTPPLISNIILSSNLCSGIVLKACSTHSTPSSHFCSQCYSTITAALWRRGKLSFVVLLLPALSLLWIYFTYLNPTSELEKEGWRDKRQEERKEEKKKNFNAKHKIHK